MITDWWKNRKTKKIAIQKEAIKEWKEQYFQKIRFPIIIFSDNDYLAVSGFDEYYYDIDINIYYVNEKCELVDSNGIKFNFRKIDDKHWVPDKKIGEEAFQSLKERIASLLYMPEHKKNIDTTNNFDELMDLITN